MIRLLPCKNCGAARFKNGSPQWVTRFPNTGSQAHYVYKCYGCGSIINGKPEAQSITLHEYNRLPTVSGDQLLALGLARQVLRDLLAQGMTADQAIREYDSRLPSAKRSV